MHARKVSKFAGAFAWLYGETSQKIFFALSRCHRHTPGFVAGETALPFSAVGRWRHKGLAGTGNRGLVKRRGIALAEVCAGRNQRNVDGPA